MARAGVTYHDLIARNRRQSALLVLGFVLFAGAATGVLAAGALQSGPDEALALAGVGVVVATGMAVWSYFGGGAAILGISRARRVTHDDDPQLHNVVEEMAIAAGIPMPAIYSIPDSALNAFATGRDPEHAAVAITEGLRSQLSRDELQAVIAHEISHVRHYDIRLALLLATLVGMVVLVTDLFWRTLRYRMWTGSGRRRSGSASENGAAAILFLAAMVLSVLAPIGARIIQLAASRQREYLADAGAVELTRHPEAMISALRKLDADREVLEVANRATAHLYIVQPIKQWEKRAQGLFSTHPTVASRIARLEQLIDVASPAGDTA